MDMTWRWRPISLVSSLSKTSVSTRRLYVRRAPLRQYASTVESLPRIARPSTWNAIIPKFLRKSERADNPVKRLKHKGWNPATFYIVIFMLIGSNAIQMVALRNEFTQFTRKADAKIALLREVIEKVQKGEDVDVEGLLGTGDQEQEKEWEEVLREVEEADGIWREKAKKINKKEAKTAEDGSETGDASAMHMEESSVSKPLESKPPSDVSERRPASKPPPRFY